MATTCDLCFVGDVSGHDAYRELFARSADCILIIEGDQFVDCNSAAVSLFGASDISEMLSVHPSDLSPPLQPDGRDSYEKANEMIGIAFQRGSHRFEWDHRRIDGQLFQAEVLLTAINEPGRRVLHSVVRDISDRKRLEEELRHAQKMEAIGKLAGGIAHDFNNLLVVMLGSCDLLDRQDLSREATEYVQQIRGASELGAGLVQQLLTFSRKQEVREEDIDLGQIVRDLMTMLERLVGEHIDLRVSTAGPATMFANRLRVEQVLLNLVSNAQDAMPDGGKLTVDVRTEDTRWVVLRVSDAGAGMSDDTRRRATEPFFTTKPMGGGTGLGLATVHNIVEQSGGTLDIDSELGHGTTVTARFPLVDRPAVPALDSPDVTGAMGDESILLVEDDPAIRQVVEILLTTAGFDVVVATDGEDALQIATEHPGRFDLIMTDVVMPKIGGPDLVLQLRAKGHDTPVIFMSGYTDAELHKLDGIGEPLDLIEKPFNLRTLVARVRAALDRDGTRPDGEGS